MLKNVCFVMTAIAGLVLATGSFAADKPLADRHFNYGAQCATCHATKMPATGTRVKNETCLACHGSYEKLAEKNKNEEPNPHRTHLGNVRCSDCHSGHGTPRLVCNDCPKFNLKTK